MRFEWGGSYSRMSIRRGSLAQHNAEKRVAVEFLVEPFVEGEPGNHVMAAIDAFSSRQLDVDFGPFATIATGPVETIGDAVAAMVVDAMNAGATTINLQVATSSGTLGSQSLHDALDAMLRAAEREVGSDPASWSREDKQRVIRMLDERGAFLLRGAVHDVADAMGVSRITVYNYLNALSSETNGESE